MLEEKTKREEARVCFGDEGESTSTSKKQKKERKKKGKSNDQIQEIFNLTKF